MKTFPLPVIAAALAAAIAAPFSVAAAGTLLFTAAFGSVIHADYVLRQQRVRLPKRARKTRSTKTRSPFRFEPHRLAA